MGDNRIGTVMSNVDNYILITFVHNGNEADVRQLNKLMNEIKPHVGNFVEVSGHSGGSKYMERDVYLFSPNYFGIEQVREAIRKVDCWLDPDHLVLIHAAQHDYLPRMWTLKELVAAEHP